MNTTAQIMANCPPPSPSKSSIGDTWERDAEEHTFDWITWASIRNGNDGRRPSGVSSQRTKLAHAALRAGKNEQGEQRYSGWKTACGREIRLYVRVDNDAPKCPTCEKRVAEWEKQLE